MENNLILQVGVKILLENENRQYLLLCRSIKKYPDIKGRWDIVGGRIDAGTALVENLQREVSEETGLELVGTPKLISAQDILRKTGYHVVRLTYYGKARGEIKLDTNENDMYKWYDWEELVRLDDVDVYFKELLSNQLLWNRMENKHTKIVFIAGPLTTGGDGSREYFTKNIQTAEQYTVALANADIAFFCAHTHTSFHHDKGSKAPEEFYYQLDFEILKRAADAVLAMPGWERSYGAKREVEWAKTRGLPIFYPSSPENINDIVEWAREI